MLPPLEAYCVNRTYIGAYSAIYAIRRPCKSGYCIDVTVELRSFDFEAVLRAVLYAYAAAYTYGLIEDRFFPVCFRNFYCFLPPVVANGSKSAQLAAKPAINAFFRINGVNFLEITRNGSHRTAFGAKPAACAARSYLIRQLKHLPIINRRRTVREIPVRHRH